MKFRIKETKTEYLNTKYTPQYKVFLFWCNIADTNWANTILCNLNFDKFGKLFSLIDAKQCISDYESYSKRTKKLL